MSTSRFDLNTYQQGDQQWSHTDTIEFVDEYSIDKGPVSERPTSGNYDDEFYYATDQGLLWRWDQGITDWVTDSLGTSTEPVPGTSHFEAVNTEELRGTYHYAGDDAELDDALASASGGNVIYLGNAEFTSNRTISNRYNIIGTATRFRGTEISGDWTITSDCKVTSVNLATGSLTFSSPRCHAYHIDQANITVDGNRCIVVGVNGGSIEVTANSDSSLLDDLNDVTVTDNGSLTTVGVTA